MIRLKIKSAYKKYEIFSWKQEQKDIKKSIIGITVLPVTLWIIFYTIPLLILSWKFNPLTKNIFWNLLPNLISASVGTFFIWIAVQAYGRGVRRYILPSYLHQKIHEWKEEIKKQKKEMKKLAACARILDKTLFNEPFISQNPIDSENQLETNAFEQLKENRKTMGETIKNLRATIDEQNTQLTCFENTMKDKNFIQRLSAIRKSYEYWKIRTPQGEKSAIDVGD